MLFCRRVSSCLLFAVVWVVFGVYCLLHVGWLYTLLVYWFVGVLVCWFVDVLACCVVVVLVC